MRNEADIGRPLQFSGSDRSSGIAGVGDLHGLATTNLPGAMRQINPTGKSPETCPAFSPISVFQKFA
jgi:hypothetical protein